MCVPDGSSVLLSFSGGGCCGRIKPQSNSGNDSRNQESTRNNGGTYSHTHTRADSDPDTYTYTRANANTYPGSDAYTG